MAGASKATLRDDGCLVFDLEIQEGDEHLFVLELARKDLRDQAADGALLWTDTVAAWKRTVPEFSGLYGEEAIRQSYAVLAGMTSSDHGMVAACTMSLPKRSEGQRKYDYRYAWIRDQCYTGQAVAALGPTSILKSTLIFCHRTYPG